MGTRKSRRGFLGLVGTAGSAAVLLAAATVRGDDPPKKGKKEKEKAKEFTGTSKKENFQEALGLAILAAHKSAKGADHLVQWTLKHVSGRDGGIAGFTELTATIEATIA